jgi:hypothetical protein
VLLNESRSELSAARGYLSVTAKLARFVPIAGVLVMALIATLDYGSGNIIGEGVADLHIDPIGFLNSLLYTWDPKPFLGSHQGFTQVYLTPYTFLYALFAAIHMPAITAQRAIIFLIYLWIAGGMYWGLKYIAPGMHPIARLAGAAAYLFNIYVAFNSAGSVPMLLTYGALPWMTGAIAAGMDGALPAVSAGALAAVFVFVGSGENPPIIALNAIILALFVVSYFLWEGFSRERVLRFAKTAISALVFSIALNLYWIVPFLGYMKSAWLSGVLDESPLMHNADSSFANVFRGLGQWAIFQDGPSGPYYSWAHAYQVGQLFAFLLWLVPIFGIAALLFRGRRSRALPFFLLVSFVSIPFAVGYYRGPLGDAITEPVYNVLYHFVPGFQMFRASYKWVGGNEFAMAGLFATFVWYAYESMKSARVAIAAAAVLLPLIVYIPIIQFKANYPMASLPAWTSAEGRMAGNAPDTRIALFPGQYLEQFHWGNPGYYMEHALLSKPMLYGYLGAATNESSDQWLRLAYRRVREGYPDAKAILRTLSVSAMLQRDDFRAVQDFAFPEADVTSNVTVAHDDLTRILGLRQSARAGANRLYPVPDPLPMVYAVTNPHVALGPAASVATASNWNALSRGQASVSLDGLTFAQVENLLGSGALVAHSRAALDDYTTSLLLPRSTRVEAQYEHQPFELNRGGLYRVSAMNLGLEYRYPLSPIRIDGRNFAPLGRETRSWQYLGATRLRAGVHHVTAGGAGYVTPILIVLTRAPVWSQQRDRVAELFKRGAGETQTIPVKRSKAVIDTPVAGWYSLSATRLSAFASLYFTNPITLSARSSTRIVAPGDVTHFELPYVLDRGVDPSQVQPLASSWYESPQVFDWNRASAVYWWVLSKDAHFAVYSPAKHPIGAVLRMQFAALAPIDAITVRTPLGSASAAVHGISYGGAPAARPLAAYLRMPEVVKVPLRLRPGINDVRIGCACNKVGLPAGLVTGVSAQEQQQYIGAVLSSTAFVTRDRSASAYDFPRTQRSHVIPVPGGAIAIAGDQGSPFEVAALPLANRTLDGDPFLQGSIKQIVGRSGRAWIGETVALNGTSYYRLFPIENPSGLNISLAQGLPNTASDRGGRITSLFVLLSTDPDADVGTNPVFALLGLGDLRTGLLPASAMRSSLSLRVDGKPVRSYVYLRRGRHTITPLESEAAIDTLTVARRGIPQSRRVALSVNYISPTRLIATLPATQKPFLLVLNESYYPQWQAHIGKTQLLHVQANGFANGWVVPPNPVGARIELDFTAQQQFIRAAIISAIAALAIILVIPYEWLRAARRRA